MTVGTADAGKHDARVVAVKAMLCNFLDNRSEKAVPLLKPGLLHHQKLIEIMEQHPINPDKGQCAPDIQDGRLRP